MRRRVAAGAAAGVALAGTAWEVQRRRDRRRIEADPEQAVLGKPPRGRPVTVHAHDGTALHAEVFGREDAPTVVLVHGWTCALRFWAYQLRALAGEARLVAFDLRGHGRSEPARNRDYSTDAFADDLDAVLETCVPEGERAVLAGHSLGAMTIVAWAGRHPDAVARLAAAAGLFNAGVGDLISDALVVRVPGRLDRVKSVGARLALAAPAPLPPQPTPLSHRLVRYIALSPSASPAQVAFTEGMVLECRAQVRARTGASLSRLDLADAVEHLTVPTLVLAGERDRLTPPVHARRLAAALPAPVDLVEIPDVGHMAPLEAHEEVDAALRRLLSEAG
jgi:pimeloyl-ACP methyl ester carboxylesterase